MSKTLPGGHYCKAHQGNTSHYAEENCVVCQLQVALEAQETNFDAQLATLRAENERFKATVEALIKAAEANIRDHEWVRELLGLLVKT